MHDIFKTFHTITISLHMSQGGNRVLHCQIHSHKVDFTFSPNENAGGSNSSVMFDISLHMSQGGNGVLHYQINSHKVDFTFSPKCWGK